MVSHTTKSNLEDTCDKISDNASMSTFKSNNTFENSDNLLVAKVKNEKYETYITDFTSTPFELVKIFKENEICT